MLPRGPRMHQHGFETFQTRSKRLPKLIQTFLRDTQDGSIMPQDVSKTIPRQHETPQYAPKTSQDLTKKPQEAPKTLEDAHKTFPRRPHDAPKRA